MLSSAILQGESSDLWKDWAVVQLSVAERALRRALLLNPSHQDAAANIGVLLFSIGRRSDATVLLRRALTSTGEAKRAYVHSLLSLCESQPAQLNALPPKQISEGYTFTAD